MISLLSIPSIPGELLLRSCLMMILISVGLVRCFLMLSVWIFSWFKKNFATVFMMFSSFVLVCSKFHVQKQKIIFWTFYVSIGFPARHKETKEWTWASITNCKRNSYIQYRFGICRYSRNMNWDVFYKMKVKDYVSLIKINCSENWKISFFLQILNDFYACDIFLLCRYHLQH